MENYPANSKRPKSSQDETPKDEPKRVEKVVQGAVVRRKKPLGKRFADTFLGGDARGVLGYVMMDVLLPAAKDTIADAVSQGIERMLFGESRSTSRRTGSRPGPAGYGHVNYNKYHSSSSSMVRREEPRSVSRRARSSHDFDEIILNTRVEADEVLDQLFNLLDKYEQVSVAELYELVGVQGDYTDAKWGWVDLRGAGVTRIRNGYLLDLPKPEPLD